MAVETKLTLRTATSNDLLFINGIIEAAVMSWSLPERVKRLSMPSYRYDAGALNEVELRVACDVDDDIVGVVGCCKPDEQQSMPESNTLLLHGIFVDAPCHRQGIGKRLIEEVCLQAENDSFDGLLVHAQPDSVIFFEKMGFQLLPVVDEEQDYKLRYWRKI